MRLSLSGEPGPAEALVRTGFVLADSVVAKVGEIFALVDVLVAEPAGPSRSGLSFEAFAGHFPGIDGRRDAGAVDAGIRRRVANVDDRLAVEADSAGGADAFVAVDPVFADFAAGAVDAVAVVDVVSLIKCSGS